MMTLVFFLEEVSARHMLEGILPRLLPASVAVRYVVFEGKQDLERQLVRRLRLWQEPDSRFVVMRDQDSGDCRAVKRSLVEQCRLAGRDDVLVRVACHELESFYLGDLRAVERGLALSGLSSHQQTRKFRDPDALGNAAEELKKLTRQAYQKRGGSRAIGVHLALDGTNASRSFNTLIDGLRRLSNVC